MNKKKFSTVGISSDSALYFYNCGTAPALPEIEAALSISNLFSSNGYIQYPSNSYATTTDKAYDCLYMNDVEAFCFTTPPSFSAYNTAIQILSQYSEGDSVLEMRKQMIEEVNHYYVRAYVCYQIDQMRNEKKYCDSNGKLLEGFSDSLKSLFRYFITETHVLFYFNSKTGQATMQATYRLGSSDSTVEIVENCGSMVLSKFLELEGGNHYNPEGYITYNECGRLTSSIPLTITKFNFQYRYL
jgi:hypothetical protein